MASEEDISTAISSYYELGEYEDIIEKYSSGVTFNEEEGEEED